MTWRQMLEYISDNIDDKSLDDPIYAYTPNYPQELEVDEVCCTEHVGEDARIKGPLFWVVNLKIPEPQS